MLCAVGRRCWNWCWRGCNVLFVVWRALVVVCCVLCVGRRLWFIVVVAVGDVVVGVVVAVVVGSGGGAVCVLCVARCLFVCPLYVACCALSVV